MYTWKELAEKFEELEEPLQNHWISVQWGDAGTWLYLKGFPGALRHPKKNKFDVLCRIAGSKLDAIPDEAFQGEKDIFYDNDEVVRWYRALWKLGPSFEYDRSGQMTDEDGNPKGQVHTGSVKEPILDSYTLCSRFSQYESKEIGESGWKKFWNNWGKELTIGVILLILGKVLDILTGWIDITTKFINNLLG